jgi:hypothetical protein
MRRKPPPQAACCHPSAKRAGVPTAATLILELCSCSKNQALPKSNSNHISRQPNQTKNILHGSLSFIAHCSLLIILLYHKK